MSSPLDLPPPGIVRPDMRKQLVRPKIPGVVRILDTGSMRPMIDHDQDVFVDSTPMDQIKEGDFVLYEHKARGINAAHRVKRVRKAANGEVYFQCEGIGNHGVPDNIAVDKTNYLGRFQLPVKDYLETPSNPLHHE